MIQSCFCCLFCTQRYKVWHWRGCSAVAILMGVISRVVFKLLLLNLAGRLLLAKEKSSEPGSVTGEINFSTSCFSYLPMEIISRTVQFACMARDDNKSPRKQQHCCWSSKDAPWNTATCNCCSSTAAQHPCFKQDLIFRLQTSAVSVEVGV